MYTFVQFWTEFLFISEIRFRMGDEEDRKLFVGGLPQEASQDDLQVHFSLRWRINWWDILVSGLPIQWSKCLSAQEYFGKFGELDSVKLKMDPMTGESVHFSHISIFDAPSRSIPGICLPFIQDWGWNWQVDCSKFKPVYNNIGFHWLTDKSASLSIAVTLIDTRWMSTKSKARA